MGNDTSKAEISGRKCFEDIFGPAPGKFCETSHGSTHYILEGREGSPLVILQHGIGSDSGRFAAIAKELTSLGFRGTK